MLFAMRQLWEYNRSLSVTDVYALSGGKSASTAYRLAVALQAKGLIEILVAEEDKRKREIRFTEKSEYLFSSIA